jgi:acyl-CoA hydrolase
MNPFEQFAKRFSNLPKDHLTQGHSVAYSRTTTGRFMEIADANNMGNVHGGIILRMVDETATVTAIKHSHRLAVTVRIDRFDFLAPAFVGDIVSVHCEIQYAGRTSMEIGVEVTAQDPVTLEIRQIARSSLTFVALDENRVPTQVPPLVPADEHEKAIIERAQLRRIQRQKIDEELKKLQGE